MPLVTTTLEEALAKLVVLRQEWQDLQDAGVAARREVVRLDNVMAKKRDEVQEAEQAVKQHVNQITKPTSQADLVTAIQAAGEERL